MINISGEQAIFYLILFPFFLIIFLMVFLKAKSIFKNVMKVMSHNKKYKIMMKEVEDMKARGEFHDWVNIPITETENAYVCRKTGYCPSMGGFFDLKYIEKFIKLKEEKDEYDYFKSEEMAKIAMSFGLSLEEVYSITDEINDIPNQYKNKDKNEMNVKKQ